MSAGNNGDDDAQHNNALRHNSDPRAGSLPARHSSAATVPLGWACAASSRASWAAGRSGAPLPPRDRHATAPALIAIAWFTPCVACDHPEEVGTVSSKPGDAPGVK